MVSAQCPEQLLREGHKDVMIMFALILGSFPSLCLLIEHW